MSSVMSFSLTADVDDAPGSVPPWPASRTTRRTDSGKADALTGSSVSVMSTGAIDA